jgi:hypothetical protein
MKVWKILTHEGEGDYGLCVGVVLDPEGNHSADEVLSAWNKANPSYLGDTAMAGPFLQLEGGDKRG